MELAAAPGSHLPTPEAKDVSIVSTTKIHTNVTLIASVWLVSSAPIPTPTSPPIAVEAGAPRRTARPTPPPAAPADGGRGGRPEEHGDNVSDVPAEIDALRRQPRECDRQS